MDIILSMEGFNQDMRKYIEETFKPNEIFHNGNAWSFDYKELQIDFITCSPENYDSNFHYLAFNDLGNLMGRLAQKIGVKYGQEGLWYNHFINGQKVGKVIISQNHVDIFNFLDLDYHRWLKGFDNLEDIFDFVKTSKFFNPFFYSLDQLNKINRERNIKRKSYMSFLEYIKDDGPNEQYSYNDIRFINENLIKILDRDFPEGGVGLEVKRLEYEYAKSKYVSAKFSGRHVMDKYGLKGKELGDAMSKFKEFIETSGKWSGKYYDDFIINSTLEHIYGVFEMVNELKKES
jgi:hypothetical protein